MTKSESQTSKRTIIYQNSKYFKSYELPSNKVFELDVGDLQTQYRMAAWYYPECYPDSDLKNYFVGITKEGNYKRIKHNQ